MRKVQRLSKRYIAEKHVELSRVGVKWPVIPWRCEASAEVQGRSKERKI